jgi:hypothetical protein
MNGSRGTINKLENVSVKVIMVLSMNDSLLVYSSMTQKAVILGNV